MKSSLFERDNKRTEVAFQQKKSDGFHYASIVPPNPSSHYFFT